MQGAESCAHWLSWACGIDTHTACEKVRVARALTELPLLSEALAKGELGYSRVRALTRMATAEERSRPSQHRAARHRSACGEVHSPPSPGQARRRNRAGRCPAREPRPHVLARRRRHRGAARAVSARDGSAHPQRTRCGDGGACGGATSGGVGQRRSGAGCRPTWDVSTRHFARRLRPPMPVPGNEPLHTGEKTPRYSCPTSHVGRSCVDLRARCAAPMRWRGWPSGCSNRAMLRLLAPDRYEVVVHVEAAGARQRRRRALRNRAPHCHCRRDRPQALLRFAGIIPVVDGPNGEPLSVGRRTRSIPPSRSAAPSAKPRPRVPLPRLHRHPAPARPSRQALGRRRGDLPRQPRLLCPTHHRLVHEGGFDVQRLDDGAFRFTNPHGLTIKPPRQRQNPSSPDTIVIQNESLGLAIDCETATAHWHGERIDYDHALMVTMASWDSGDTRPEAGSAAGDWNPS